MNKIEHRTLITSLRPYILIALKQLHGDVCTGCGKQAKSYEIDHKRYTERPTIHDLQLLCRPCHLLKTGISHENWLSNGGKHCETCTCHEDNDSL